MKVGIPYKIIARINQNSFFLELSSTGDIEEWGECLPDCPQEDVASVCIMEPEFPKFSDGTQGTTNFSSNYKYGSGLPTKDVGFF